MTPTATGVDAVLEQARIGMRRLEPHETQAAGALLIDTRTDRQRGDRMVLEWRLDPRSASRIRRRPDATSTS
jgi:hypothetical protein